MSRVSWVHEEEVIWPLCVQMQLYPIPTHVLRHHAGHKYNVLPLSPSIYTRKLISSTQEQKNVNTHIWIVWSYTPLTTSSPTKSTQYISSVCPGRVSLNLTSSTPTHIKIYHQKRQSIPRKHQRGAPNVERIILPNTNNRHASRYTAPTWPGSVETNLPIRPSHTRTADNPTS